MTTVTILLSVKALEDFAKDPRQLSGLGKLKLFNFLFKPVDPATDDNELRRYFSTEVENQFEASELIEQLLGLEKVEAAYVKPEGVPPN